MGSDVRDQCFALKVAFVGATSSVLWRLLTALQYTKWTFLSPKNIVFAIS